MENKKKTISDYEKRLMEDRAMLDELVEENYMSGSEMVKNQLKHFRQELDYMENQLHFIKYEMREQKVTEATVKNNIEEKVVQKDNVQVNNEAVSQIVSEKNDKVMDSQSVNGSSEETTVKQAVIAKTSEATVKDQPIVSKAPEKMGEYKTVQSDDKLSIKHGAKDLEKMVGKSLMGVFASILVFISLILFATIILPYFNDTAKMICTYLVSFAFLGVGLYLVNKEQDNKFYLALLGCGVGALYISLILSNFYFKVIGDIPLYILIALWGIGVCYLAKYKNQIFQIIGLSGVTIAMIFGCNLCMDTEDGIKFLALIIFYIISYGIFYFTHFSKDYYGNLVQNIFGLVNGVYLYIASENIVSENAYISKILILVIIAINIGIALYCEIGDAKYSFTIMMPSYILVFILQLYNVISSEELCGIIAWLLCVMFIALIEWKDINDDIGKTIVNTIIVIIAFFVVCNIDPLRDHGIVPMVFLPFILLGFYRKNDIYKLVPLFLFLMYVFSGEINIFERVIFGVIVYGTIFGLMCLKKYKSTPLFSYIYHVFTVIFLYYASYQVFAVELRDDNVGNMLGFLLSNVFNIAMLKLNFYSKNEEEEEEDYNIIFNIINTIMMVVGSVLIGSQLGTITHFIIILTTLAIFMLNVKNILDKYDGYLAGVYIGGKFTILLIIILASFDSPNYIVSIGCFIASIISIMFGFKGKYKSLRIYGLVLSMISIFKLIMIDINYENTLGNALSFLGSGLLCFIISMIYNYIDKKFNEEE